MEKVRSWGVIFSQDFLTGVTEDIVLCREERSRVEIRAGFENHLWTLGFLCPTQRGTESVVKPLDEGDRGREASV
jgi:hypothetical protein